MSTIYSPLLLITATIESREAHRVLWNRRHGEADDDDVQEWEQAAEVVNFEVDDPWKELVAQTRPNLNTDPCTLEVTALREQVAALTQSVNLLLQEKNNGSA